MTFDFFCSSRKRAREDEEDEFEVFPEAKRPYSLPFRTSPTIKHTRAFSLNKRSRPKPLFTQTVTPQDSDEEDNSAPFANAGFQQSSWTENVAPAPSVNNTPELEMDMGGDSQMVSPRSFDQEGDMDMYSPNITMLSPKPSPRTLLSPHVDALGLQETANAGRIPTPIYGHFQTSATNSLTSSPEEPSPSSLQSDKDIEYDQYLRSRRLPSPISEDEAMDFPPPSKVPEPATTPGITKSYGGLLRTPARLAQPLSAGLAQKHGKIMFSMGFRADCEMCRNRVPGHSNHIFRI